MLAYYRKYLRVNILVFGFLGIAWLILYFMVVGAPVVMTNILAYAMPEFMFWIGWACLSPAILCLVDRRSYPLRPFSRKWTEHLVFALLAGALAFVLNIVLATPFYLLAESLDLEGAPTIQEALQRRWLNYLTLGIPLYAILYFLVGASGLAGRYVEEVAQERSRSAELRAQYQEAELKAMKMQLQPHFLFNALNTISALVHENADLADQMLAQLGDFLRATLAHGSIDRVPLSKELSFVKQYLKIEQFRLEDKLTVAYEIGPLAGEAMVPHLLLQPLIENAIKHGISRLTEGGEVRICAYVANEILHLSVVNSASSITLKAATALHFGTGLQNVSSRLKTAYGSKASLTLSSSEPSDFCVLVTLPFVNALDNRAGQLGANMSHG